MDLVKLSKLLDEEGIKELKKMIKDLELKFNNHHHDFHVDSSKPLRPTITEKIRKGI